MPTPLLSLTRFGLVAFPAVLALADLGGRRWLHIAAVTVGVAWLTTSVVKWSLWNWVA